MSLSVDELACSEDPRSQELATVASIYPDELTILSPTSATVSIPVCPLEPLRVAFIGAVHPFPSYATFSHLPPITLEFDLPPGYPDDAPASVEIKSDPSWLPEDKAQALKQEIKDLWEEYGRGQIVYTAIDHVQQCVERRLDYSNESPISIRDIHNESLCQFDARTKKEVFERGSYDCGICLDPKKGTACHAIRSCTHVYCRPCLVEYYTSLITEGNVASVRCMNPACVKKASQNSSKRTKATELPQTLPPDELSEIGVSQELVYRYTFLKKKKALEVDPRTLYCPRQWCQGPSRASVEALEKAMDSAQGGFYLTDHEATLPPTPPLEEDGAEEDEGAPQEKLQQCSTCGYAFCRVCKKSWHGGYQICRAPDAELTEEERQNEHYLRDHTTPCPTCLSATLKSHGCNHMICPCGTHFCFLCSAFLPPENPYGHFNTKGSECYQRLWEGEDGDEENIQLIRNHGRRVEIPPEPQARQEAPAPEEPEPQPQFDFQALLDRNARRIEEFEIVFEDDDSEAEWEVDFDEIPEEPEERPFAHRPPRGRRHGPRAAAWRR